MKLLFERSHPGRRCTILPACDVPTCEIDPALCREQAPHLPQMSENELSRHYTELAKQTYGVNDGFYPLGSCTMKYNPKVNDQIAALPGFASIHPLQPEETVQGCLEALDLASKYLCEITAMDDMTFQPAAGAHGELGRHRLHCPVHQQQAAACVQLRFSQPSGRQKDSVGQAAEGEHLRIQGYSVPPHLAQRPLCLVGVLLRHQQDLGALRPRPAHAAVDGGSLPRSRPAQYQLQHGPRSSPACFSAIRIVAQSPPERK